MDILPSGNWGLIFSAILPILIFNWVGFEVQNGAGEEMHNPQRDVPRSLIRSGALAVIAYTIPIAIILFTLSKSQLSSASGFVQAFQTVSSVLPAPLGAILGWATALGVILALASSGGSWIIGANRAYAIAALDRAAPVVLGRFSVIWYAHRHQHFIRCCLNGCYGSRDFYQLVWFGEYWPSVPACAWLRDLDNNAVIPVHLSRVPLATL